MNVFSLKTAGSVLLRPAALVGALITQSVLLAGPAFATGYFVSIDSLRGDHVDILSNAKVFSAPHGFKWLHDKGWRASKAWPVEITLTAPSHVSNITCSPPRAHGIVANSFMVNGQKENGFSYDIKSETMWEAAKRQGKKVLAVAYVGADGKTDRRRADVGIGYPSDSLVGKSQSLSWEVAALAPSAGWTGGDTIDAVDRREASASMVINGQTGETQTLNFYFVSYDGKWRVILDTDKDLTNGVVGSFDLAGPRLQTLDAFFVETQAASPIAGFKKRVRLTFLGFDGTKASVYASTATYNNAYPEEFRKILDDKNMVWVDPYISSSIAPQTATEYVQTTIALDNFLADVVVVAKSKYTFDAVLFYQPRLDEFSHKYAGELSVPLNPLGANDTERAFIVAFQAVDRNISRMVGVYDRRKDVVAVMGDHGMEPIAKQVNVGPFIREVDPTAAIVVSGALVLVYPTTGDVDMRVGENLDRKLSALTLDGVPVHGMTHRKDAVPADQWQYGEATWAFTSGKTFWYTNSMAVDTFLTPPITGMHGHDFSVVPNMATTFMMKAPGVAHAVIPEMGMIDALPTFLAQIGMDPPANCEGHARVARKPGAAAQKQ